MENMQLKSGGAEDSPLFWCVGPAHMPRTFLTTSRWISKYLSWVVSTRQRRSADWRSQMHLRVTLEHLRRKGSTPRPMFRTVNKPLPSPFLCHPHYAINHVI